MTSTNLIWCMFIHGPEHSWGAGPLATGIKLAMSAVALAVTVLYSALVIRAMLKERVGKKFYAFMLNRCAGDALFLLFYVLLLLLEEDV